MPRARKMRRRPARSKPALFKGDRKPRCEILRPERV